MNKFIRLKLFYVIFYSITMLSCSSTKTICPKTINKGVLTQLHLNEEIKENTKYPRKYIIEHIKETDKEVKNALRFDSLCRNQIIEEKDITKIKLPSPHNASTLLSSEYTKSEHKIYLQVSPLYKANETNKFCFIINSGDNIEYSGESWGILYIASFDNEGKLILGEIVQDYIVWF